MLGRDPEVAQPRRRSFGCRTTGTKEAARAARVAPSHLSSRIGLAQPGPVSQRVFSEVAAALWGCFVWVLLPAWLTSDLSSRLSRPPANLLGGRVLMSWPPATAPLSHAEPEMGSTSRSRIPPPLAAGLCGLCPTSVPRNPQVGGASPAQR